MIHHGDEKTPDLTSTLKSAYYSLFKNNEGKVFRLVFSDGEAATVKLLHVDDEYHDFIYDLIASSETRKHY